MSFLTGLACIRCGAAFPAEPRFDGCPRCRGEAPSNLTPTYDYDGIRRAFRVEALRDRPPTMWRYREFLPPDEAEVVTLAEGMTPLIPAPRLGSRMALPRLHIKDESRNPTWSFKDRLAATALAMGRRFGARVVGVSSSGNAGAAAAAYAARAGMGFREILGRPYWEVFPRLSGLRAVAEVRERERAPRQAGGRGAAGRYPWTVVGMRRRYVAVCGPAEAGERETAWAEEIGRLLAEASVVLVCGGLGGVMDAAARGCEAAGGVSIGVLPSESRAGASSHLSVAVPTGLGEARNALVVRAADAVIAVSGEFGTLSEIALALKAGIPVVGLETWQVSDEVIVARSPEEAVTLAIRALEHR